MKARRGRTFGAICLALCITGAPLAAQQPGAGPDTQQLELLRGATAREAVGDLAGAEAMLREALNRQPTSVAAALSLQRVLRQQDRLDELVPVLDNFLVHDPTSVLARLMLLRTYSTLDRVAALDSAAQDWLRAAPGSPVPVRDIAAVWRERGAPARALAVLEDGRQRFGPDAFALPLGEVYADLGRYGQAVEAWDRAIGPDAHGFDAVRRELRAMPDGDVMVPALVDRLTRTSPSPARRVAAVRLALDAGMEDAARHWTEEALQDMPQPRRRSFLLNVAGDADAGQLSHFAYWAYNRLLAADASQAADSLADAATLHARAAELALTLGDTVAAERHYGAIEAAFPAGAPQRRRASALRIHLMAQRGDAGAAADALATFRKAYPDADETDRLAAAVGVAYLRRGARADARRVVEGVRGPRCALLRGRLALAAGHADSARMAFAVAAAGLRGAEATVVIELTDLLAAVSPATAAQVAAALGAHAPGADGVGPDTAMLQRLETVTRAAPDADRSAVLDYAASLADSLDPAAAARYRRAIVEGYPGSRQAAPALLGLADALAAQPDSLARAQALLERLILDHPRSALVPEARRRLTRLKGMVPPDSASARRGP